MINIVRKKDGKIIQSPQKKQLRTLMPKIAGGTRPKGISKDLLKKIENFIMQEKKKPQLGRKSKGMSPGKMKKPSSFMKRAGKGLSRAGMAGMSKAVFSEAKKLKSSGTISDADMKRAREMLKKRKGK